MQKCVVNDTDFIGKITPVFLRPAYNLSCGITFFNSKIKRYYKDLKELNLYRV